MTPKQLRDSANRPWDGDSGGSPSAPACEPPACDMSMGTLRRHAGTIEAHTCPYDYDVNDDRETKCHCCATCEQKCADDI